MKAIRQISRILVGIVFIFSGFVKAVDPLGTAYKFEDYFIHFGMEALIPWALALSIIMIAAEFIVGWSLLVGVKIKLGALGLLIFMVYFTILTFYLALKNPVKDCGCFGDAIILTNWETFYKNLVIMVPTLIVYFGRKKYKPLFCCKAEWAVVFAGVAIVLGISYYSLRHLPIVDFRPWKVGTSMINENAAPPKSYVTYKNKETGEEKEYLSTNYPWNDSVWMSEWEFVTSRVEEIERPENEIKIDHLDGYEVTNEIIGNPEYHFLLVMYYIDEASTSSFKEINELYKKCEENNISFVGLTASLRSTIEKLQEEQNLEFEFYNADDISLKTIVRSNPGLVLMKNGVIKAKWHHKDIPTFEEFKEKFLEKAE